MRAPSPRRQRPRAKRYCGASAARIDDDLHPAPARDFELVNDALDTWLPGLRQPTKAQVEHAMNGHIVAQAALVGRY